MTDDSVPLYVNTTDSAPRQDRKAKDIKGTGKELIRFCLMFLAGIFDRSPLLTSILSLLWMPWG